MSNEFFNKNYLYYQLPISKLIQSLINICAFAIFVGVMNIVIFVISKCCAGGRLGNFMKSRVSQFKLNAYIRLYMLAYFDVSFFALMKILDGNNGTTVRKVALFFSYGFFVLSVIAPVAFVAILLRRFDVLTVKEAKAKFNTLVLKIDKNSKWRVIHVAFFFGRRLLTGKNNELTLCSCFAHTTN